MGAVRVAVVLVAGLVAAVCAGVGSPMKIESWPQWETYARHFVQADGRVIEHSAEGRTSSEGQAYALFFALVADDRARFERILSWTEGNLAGGDLRTRLPGWHWGRDEAGGWRLLDTNAASDADIWIAYALVEAGRLWCEPRFTILAEQVASLVAQTVVDELPGLGPMLLPGPQGFRLDPDTWRLNPSYLPLPVLRRLAETRLTGPWAAIADATVLLLEQSTTEGIVPDWVWWRRDQGVLPDEVSRSAGSYEAIRVYLWAAITSDRDPDRARLLPRMGGLERAWRTTGAIPERLEPGGTAGVLPRQAPPGFYAVLAAWLKSTGDLEAMARVRGNLDAMRFGGFYGAPARYYDQNLAMFAEGWLDGWFRFMSDGRLEPKWEKRCEPR